MNANERANAHELVLSMMNIIDGCTDLIASEAKKEAQREAGKTLRRITWKMRHERAVELVAQARNFLDTPAS